MGSGMDDTEKFSEELQNLLADFLAGGVDVTVAIVFNVRPAGEGEPLSPEGAVFAAGIDVAEKEGITVDGAAD